MPPAAYTSVSLATLLASVLERHVSAKLIVVCSEQRAFLEKLQRSIQNLETTKLGAAHGVTEDDNEQHAARIVAREDESDAAPFPLLSRTLRRLSLSKAITLAFCPSIRSLRAYLATLPNVAMRDALESEGSTSCNGPSSASNNGAWASPALILIGPIALHEGTSTFSAQGLNETMSDAVEAASRGNVRLVVVETSEPEADLNTLDTHADIQMTDRADNHEAFRAEFMENDEDAEQGDIRNPWDRTVPILNSTTKLLGGGRDRVLLETRVSVRTVFERWCQFEELPKT